MKESADHIDIGNLPVGTRQIQALIFNNFHKALNDKLKGSLINER